MAEGHTAEGMILGTVLYEMATGRQAFQGDTTISTITAILRDEPEPDRRALPTAASR